jgi:hypothetical protein
MAVTTVHRINTAIVPHSSILMEWRAVVSGIQTIEYSNTGLTPLGAGKKLIANQRYHCLDERPGRKSKRTA